MRILLALVVLGFVVFIHELGHFVVAKISNMRVEKFSIGMGPAITSIKKGETDYVIGAFPAGGYVQVTGEHNEYDDEDEMPVDDPRRYGNRPLISRLLFAFAGSFMNLLIAVIIMIGLFMVQGVSVPTPSDKNIVASVVEGSPADIIGLKANDEILEINGKKINSWDDIVGSLSISKGSQIEILYNRLGEKSLVSVTPEKKPSGEGYFLGITRLEELKKEKLNFSDATKASLTMTKKISLLVYNAVKDIITGKTAINDKEGGLTGPVGIVKAIDNSIDRGLEEVVFLISMLSINLGLMNLLPLPALDGSKILFLLLEGIRGVPIDSSKENLVNFLGFVFFMGLMIYVTINDIASLG